MQNIPKYFGNKRLRTVNHQGRHLSVECLPYPINPPMQPRFLNQTVSSAVWVDIQADFFKLLSHITRKALLNIHPVLFVTLM